MSWLRSHNYPEFRFLVEIRELTDEEAFRLSDIENRAREDISDFERARDYLRALDAYYGGKQQEMAERINVTASWLSRYLDMARLPAEIIAAFDSPHDLGIKHVTQIKPLLKPEDRRSRVLAEGRRIASARASGESVPQAPADVVRMLAAAAEAPKKTGSPKRTGKVSSTVKTSGGTEILRVDGHGRAGVTLTLLPKAGASRADAEHALGEILDRFWPAS